MTVLSVIVASNSIVLVEGKYNPDKTVEIIKDETFTLESGERHVAYAKMSQRIKDRLSKDIETVILKASSGGQFPAKTAILEAAELRGVFLSAIPSKIEVIQRQKKLISRGKSRNVDEYVRDDEYFNANFNGVGLRKGSRETAFLILNEADK